MTDRVTIHVIGGVAEIINAPNGVEIEILDFDVQGADLDPTSEFYSLCHCPVKESEGQDHVHAGDGYVAPPEVPA